MELTTKKALQICAELWRWLESHPVLEAEEKLYWPGWDKYGSMRHCCPFCELTEQECELCPLNALWRQGKEIGDPYFNCIDYTDSPYKKWVNAKTPKTRKKYAGIIAEYAENELNKLQEK